MNFRDKNILGHGQFSGLGMQVADRVFGNLSGRRSLASAFKDADGTVVQRTLRRMDHRRMDPIGARQVRYCALSLPGLQRSTRLLVLRDGSCVPTSRFPSVLTTSNFWSWRLSLSDFLGANGPRVRPETQA